MAEANTPDGDPIETQTFWLDFDGEQVAISADLTRFNAAMRRLKAAFEEHSREAS